METSPPSAFVVAEPHFLLEFLIVSFRQRSFVMSTSRSNCTPSGSVENQYLVGSASSCGHSISSHSSGRGSVRV